MAPATLLVVPSSNPASRRRPHHLRRQTQNNHHHPHPRASSHVDRLLDATLQPSGISERLPPPPIVPVPSESVMLVPEPSAAPISANQLQGPNQSDDIPGNIVAAIVVVFLVLGGLIGLIVGGEILRRQTRIPGENVPARTSRCFGHRKSESAKRATESRQKHVEMSREKLPNDGKKMSPLARPPPTHNRERQRRFIGVWPIRNLSRALCKRSCPEEVERRVRHSSPPVTAPQTTWSEFSPVLLYVPPTRTVLSRIPEEVEEYENQMDSQSGSVVWTPRTKQPESPHDVLADGASPSESSVTVDRRVAVDRKIKHKVAAGDEDGQSLKSSPPDMTSDEGESSRSSMASLQSIDDKNDHESLRGEVFELRRAQTKSMQMNKGVLLSLSFNSTLNDGQNLESTGEKLSRCSGPSRLSCAPADAAEGGRGCVGRELSLAMLGGSFSAVDLDEFPSPPSVLPVIPSFVSGF